MGRWVSKVHQHVYSSLSLSLSVDSIPSENTSVPYGVSQALPHAHIPAVRFHPLKVGGGGWRKAYSTRYTCWQIARQAGKWLGTLVFVWVRARFSGGCEEGRGFAREMLLGRLFLIEVRVAWENRVIAILFGEGYNRVILILYDKLGKGFSLVCWNEMNIFEIIRFRRIFFLSKFVPEKSN